MTATATETVQHILDHLDRVTGGPDQFMAKCPAHKDRHASLSIGHGEDGRALLNCHAGCTVQTILAALKLSEVDLFPPKARPQHRHKPMIFETPGAAAETLARTLKAKPAGSWTYYNADGTEALTVLRFNLPDGDKTYRPLHRNGGGWSIGDPPGKLPLYHLADLDGARRVYVVEGEKCAEVATHLGLTATTSAHGAEAAGKTDWRPLAGHDVPILRDNDKGGNDYGNDVATILTALGCTVRVVLLPGLPEGGDIEDFAEARDGQDAETIRAEIEAQVNATPIWTAPVKIETTGAADDLSNQPEIFIDTDESRVVTETIAALTYDKEIYQRGGVLVRIRRDATIEDGVIRPAGSPTIQALPAANLRERLTRVARFIKVNAKGKEVPSHPAAWVVSEVDARGDWPCIRPLTAVSDAPVLRPDGTIWQTPGYDSATGVLFESNQTFPPVPEHPTIDDARRALGELLEVVCDFPFQAPEHKAVWLAALLTPAARFAFAGPTPLVLVDSNIAGAGKGLSVHTIGRICTGRDVAVSAYAHDGDELRKRITSIALAGDRLVLLDNLEGAFGNATLDRLLTATYWKDRILGRNEECNLPLTATWYATGNNVAIAADTARRVIHIRLDTMDEHPDQRTGFRHPELLEWVDENRPRLLTAALTILAAYFKAGCPAQALPPYGSFEGWSALVRQAVVWIGLPDPCLTRAKLMESADVTSGSLSQLTEAWQEYARCFHGGGGLKVSEMLTRLYPAEHHSTPTDAASVDMRAALETVTGASTTKPPTAKQVAGRLRFFRRRPIGGHFLDIDDAANRKQGRTWVLRDVEQVKVAR
ncbi:MAG: hypothetical protein NTU94_08895 [Planctomycetota bacterium]|nr:hypothetical protein [Planctomycetota bacterium]